MIKYFALLLTLFSLRLSAQPNADEPWKAKWINCGFSQSATNSWVIARQRVVLKEDFKTAYARIAVDSKYWLYVNEKLVVFEGGLKRGPNKSDTYYDEVDLTPYLSKGENTFAILHWYFGKDGFSHISSGTSGLLFELYTDKNLQLISDKNWHTLLHPAYSTGGSGQQPNWRLPESNVYYDARKEDGNWFSKSYKPAGWSGTMEVGNPGDAPWNKLVKRTIPLWKDYGLKPYVSAPVFPMVSKGDTLKCKLLYNAQITPYFKINAPVGLVIHMLTDNYMGGGDANVRAEYITKEGVQEFEALAWTNGHEMYYVIPQGVEILDLKYRETGFQTSFAGNFTCDDTDLNVLWQKSQRTLYITMRDNYMDCPDRERAQWPGDAVNEIAESFYALCPKSHLLAQKFYLETAGWKRADSTLYGPVPSKNWGGELPMQMLNTVGYYGIWNYFMHTGDTATVKALFPHIKKYLALWKIQSGGLVSHRAGGWDWGDWGENIDMPVLENAWYYLACSSYGSMASVLGNENEAKWAADIMSTIKTNYNKNFWNGTTFRSPANTKPTDDRANAMAVLAGMAAPTQYAQLLEVFKTQYHASPYMEKYVIEALIMMGANEEAQLRLKKRFMPMIKSPLTTLWEGWGIGADGYGGGTYDHAWSGGGLTILSQYVAGIEPISPAYKKIRIRPLMGKLETAEATISSVAGNVSVKHNLKNSKNYILDLVAPGSSALKIYPPPNKGRIIAMKINGKSANKYIEKILSKQYFELPGGKYNIEVTYQ